jgi:glycerate kinase
LMADALGRGAGTLYIALGGSATNDAGLGMASALGWRFLDASGGEVNPLPENFPSIRRVRPPENAPPCTIIALCDVQNPLLGPAGATRMFGPQKGATPEMVEKLEAALQHVADLCRDELGRDFREAPGAGATGGLAFGLMTFCGARLEKGFEAVSRLLDLEARIARANLVITGEGRIDAQTEHGKGPAEVARLARRHGRPVIAFAGWIDGEPEDFDALVPISNGPLTLAESQRDAAELLQAAAERAARLLKISL